MAGLAQVRVQIDEAGPHQRAVALHDLGVAGVEVRSQLGNAAVNHAYIHIGDAARGDHGAAAQQHVTHGSRLPEAETAPPS